MQRRRFLQASAGLIGGGLLLPAQLRAGSAETMKLVASRGEHRFMAEQSNPTSVMFYNQSLPGPVLRIPQGRETVIEFANSLDQPTSVHWHGLRIDNAMDGVPGMTQAPVAPGESFRYRLNPPDAGTYWYHTHMQSWEQLALGLAGILIVEEKNPPMVDRDLVFAIDDWRLDHSGRLDTASLGSMHDWSHAGRVGNFITVNGKLDPAFDVAAGERVRLRLINIANARVMRLLINQPNASVIAIDGQPVEPYALERGELLLAPGQRTDLVIDMTAAPEQVSPIEIVIREHAYQVAHFKLAAKPKREQLLETPIALEPNPVNRIKLPSDFKQVPVLMQGGAMSRMPGAIYRGREMGMRELVQNRKMWAINGIAGLPAEPLFSVERGTAISLEVDNDNRWLHVMHVHGHHFISDLEPGIWRDSVLFQPRQRGNMRFVADNPGKWLLHCHMVEHMAGGMSTWFEVT